MYATRSSNAIHVLHSDIEYGAHLFEQNTDSEFNDNIVVALTLKEDLAPVASVDDGIRFHTRQYAYVPTDSNSDGTTDLLDDLLNGQPVTQVEHVREGEILAVPGEYATIQDALDEAQPGDTIQIAAGTYQEDLEIDMNRLRIEGAGAGSTIIQGSDQFGRADDPVHRS